MITIANTLPLPPHIKPRINNIIIPALLLEISAFYDSSSSSAYSHPLQDVLSGLSKLESHGVRVFLFDKDKLSNGELKKAVEEIRRIKPQSRGSVVASGGQILPISGSKKLNLQNTPVLIVRQTEDGSDSSPIYVFPCKVGESYYSALDGISFLFNSLPNLGDLPGEMEESLILVLKSHPEKLESGLVFCSSENSLTTGKADLVFTDSQSKFLLVEVERVATDSAIGQVLRLAAGFERDQGTGRVRCAIVCYRINDNVLAGAERAGIEVWKAQKNGEFLKLSK